MSPGKLEGREIQITPRFNVGVSYRTLIQGYLGSQASTANPESHIKIPANE
jgi:hypothetical protein